MAFGKMFILSLIGFISPTQLSFNPFCMSVSGLKSFESSCCVYKSPTRSDRNVLWDVLPCIKKLINYKVSLRICNF